MIINIDRFNKVEVKVYNFIYIECIKDNVGSESLK